MLKQSQHQRTKWVVACVQKTVVLASQRLHIKETSSRAPARFFRMRSRRAVFSAFASRSLVSDRKNYFQNEVLGSSFAYLLSTPEYVCGGENHPAGLPVSVKILEEIGKGRHSHIFFL